MSSMPDHMKDTSRDCGTDARDPIAYEHEEMVFSPRDELDLQKHVVTGATKEITESR